MLRLRKLFKLPSPVELGWSEYNALESREFSDEPQGKTWEDWHEFNKAEYPVRYFFAETLPSFLRYKIWFPLTRPIKDAHYWLVSHIIPSRRYHMLDLRQAGGYQYGWQDVPEKMLYAMFNLLGEYLEEEPYDLTTDYTREEINADPGMKQQQDALDEAKAIYHWWIVERQIALSNENEMRNLWHSAKKDHSPMKEAYWAQLQQMGTDMETKTDEMVARLMKIRRTLWT